MIQLGGAVLEMPQPHDRNDGNIRNFAGKLLAPKVIIAGGHYDQSQITHYANSTACGVHVCRGSDVCPGARARAAGSAGERSASAAAKPRTACAGSATGAGAAAARWRGAASGNPSGAAARS